MKQKLLQAFEAAWQERVKFAKYVIVGISSFAIYLTLLFILVEWFNLKPTVGVVIDQAIVIIFNFLMNKFWSFGSKASSHRELVRYLALTAWNYIFSVTTMHYGNGVLHIPYAFVAVATAGCMVSWNFLLFRFWVYRERKEENIV